MILKIRIDEQTWDVDVPEEILGNGGEFYANMDSDMDRGWQMSRTWVENPDSYQRCQIVADKILGCFHTENKKLLLLMAGYILHRMPGVREVVIDTSGDITLTEVNV